ncbi:MAG: TRAP transporter small permease [Alphaproteobacteria bacterium]
MSHAPPKSRLDKAEESLIALILGLMTLITFANVIARYVFNANILWALEATVFLFAWLVLLGASYGVKTSSHIGVDLLVNMANPALRKIMTFLALLACLAFCGLLLKGSIDYWWSFATENSFLEVNDIPAPDMLQPAFEWLARIQHDYNMSRMDPDFRWDFEYEAYEKLPRYIPYFALPLGMTMLTLRFALAGWDIWRGNRDLLISSHEVEEELEELSRAHDADSEAAAKAAAAPDHQPDPQPESEPKPVSAPATPSKEG